MTVFQSIFLSILQGITEFLPISSSGHLILIPHFLKWPDQGLAFDAVIHIGTSLAAVLYFHKDIIEILKGIFTKKNSRFRKLGFVLLVSVLPSIAVGVLFKSFISSEARMVIVVAVNLMIWGAVLIGAEFFANKKKEKKNLTDISYKQGLLIGFSQALALFPGTSRSGITISAGLFTNLSRTDAVKFSFFLGIPVILGAGFFSLIELITASEAGGIPISIVLIGLVCAFLSGFFAIHFLLKLINKKGLIYFGVYRIILAIVLLVLL